MNDLKKTARIELAPGESRVFPDGERRRFVAGGGCRDCDFYRPREIAVGAVQTTCLATARAALRGDPIYPCSRTDRSDGLYGRFERVAPPRRGPSFGDVWRALVWALVVVAALIVAGLSARVANGAEIGFAPRQGPLSSSPPTPGR